MAWELQTTTVKTQNGVATFQFQEPVLGLIYGISGFGMSYSHSHAVMTFQVQLSCNQGFPIQALAPVQIVYNMVLCDDSNHSADSYSLTISVLAWTGQPGSPISGTLGMSGLASNGVVTNVNPPVYSFPAGQVLSAFALSNRPHDHNVQAVSVGVSIVTAGNSLGLKVTAETHDASGHYAPQAMAGGGIFSSLEDTGLQFSPSANYQSTKPETVNFNHGTLSNAAAFLTGFQAQYSGSHQVLSIKAGYSAIAPAGASIVIGSPGVTMTDGKNTQDDSKSYVSLVLIGLN